MKWWCHDECMFYSSDLLAAGAKYLYFIIIIHKWRNNKNKSCRPNKLIISRKDSK